MEKDVLTTIMAFIYTIGHWIGDKIVWIIQSAAGIIVPPAITDAVGMLVILSIFLAIAEVARKAIWIVVAVGWVLIVLRIAIIMAE